jgi:ubiquinone/menaquinone biosynthesis C-methylase UbiE
MSAELMKQQWDEMARKNPYFSITSWPEFERVDAVDTERFWEIGRIHASNLLAWAGVAGCSHRTMVEIGCGLGRMTHHFASEFRHVYALDISREMVGGARRFWRSLSNVTFLEGSGEDLAPITDGIADFVLSFYVLNHVTNAGTVLRYVEETARVLGPRGLALLHLRLAPDAALQQPTWRERLARLLTRAPEGPWWDDGIERQGVQGGTDLCQQFSRIESWRGCEVPWKDLSAVLDECGLSIRRRHIAPLGGTHFGFLSLRKRASWSLVSRHPHPLWDRRPFRSKA